MKRKLIILVVLVLVLGSFAACQKTENSSDKEEAPQEISQFESEEVKTEKFPDFDGEDFAGNPVDESIFKEKKLTVLKLWFNECEGCIQEMPWSEELNTTLQEKDGQVVGLNIMTMNDEEALEQAREILKSQGVTYKNISVTGDKKAIDYITGIQLFPTTIVVDQEGNIIAGPISGDFDKDEFKEKLLNYLDGEETNIKVNIEHKQTQDEKSGIVLGSGSEIDPELEETLNKKMDMIFENNGNLWDKVFAKANDEETMTVVENENFSYGNFLRDLVEQTKSELSEEDIQSLHEDIIKIEEIEAEFIKNLN